MKSKYKIFMGMSNMAGYFTKLQSGFDKLGIDTFILDVTSDPFNYGVKQSCYIRYLRFLFSQRGKGILPYKLLSILLYKISLIPFFLWTLFKFDVFIFSFNMSFFRLMELPLLKLFKKRIIFIYLGSDSRPPYMSGIDINLKKSSLIQLINDSKNIKAKIKRVEKYADVIINSPASGQFHEKDFINWMCIGMPTNIEEYDKKENKINKINIVHAPSRPITKGTLTFLEILNRLKDKYDIEYIELVNKSNSEVIKALKQCDLVLDEVYSDIPVAGLSSEAAAFKKVSIVTGYYKNEINNDLPSKKYMIPSMYDIPENIEKNIIKLIENKDLRDDLGERMYKYILNNWSSLEVAKKFVLLIENRFPLEWIYNTKSNEYIYGYGISKNHLKDVYREIFEKYGIESFQLSHNERLLNEIKKFIKED